MQHFIRKKNQIVVGIPSKGRLKKHVLDFLREKGYVIPAHTGRRLQTRLNNDSRFRVVFLHPKDIPLMIEQGAIDTGFSGLDLIYETRATVRPIIKIGLGHVRMALAVPCDAAVNHPFHLMGKTVGTAFPNLTREYFERLKVDVAVQEIRGASEGMPYLGVVDAIMDVVETGKSLTANHLKIIDDHIFHSECVLMVGKPELQKNYQLLNQFLRTIYVQSTH